MYRIYIASRDGNYDFAQHLAAITTNDEQVQAEFSMVRDPMEFDNLAIAVSVAKLIMTASSKEVDVVKVEEVKKLDFEKIW